MKTFKELVYERPDLEKEKGRLEAYRKKIGQAETWTELRNAILEQEKASRHVRTMYSLACIRNNMDTTDRFYDEEVAVLNRQQKELELYRKEAGKALLDSPFLEEVEKEFGPLYVKNLESAQRLSSPEAVEDTVREAELIQEYNRVISACHTEFEGED